MISIDGPKQLPFVHFHAKLPEEPEPSQLVSIYAALYEKARAAEREFTGIGEEIPEIACNRPLADISHDLAMTTTGMAVCPRVREGALISSGKDRGGDEASLVALNGTLLAAQ